MKEQNLTAYSRQLHLEPIVVEDFQIVPAKVGATFTQNATAMLPLCHHDLIPIENENGKLKTWRNPPKKKIVREGKNYL